MDRQLISSGSDFEKEIGYSRAVREGEWVFLSGTTGFNYRTMEISDDMSEQTEQCFLNIKEALDEAGAELKHIVRVLYVVPHVEEFKKAWPVMRKYLGNIQPAATMISAGLYDKRMKIEIEVTAKLDSSN